jgi:membrane carboxypeptidase/penicillin-binding protein PbpC
LCLIDLTDDWGKLKERVDELRQFFNQHPENVPGQVFQDMLVVGEDHRYHCHLGFDVVALIRAIWRTYFCGDRQGGSTIAMQAVRTVTGRYDRSISRKIREIILACKLTIYAPRGLIPPMYLWIAYYGSSMDNFQQACIRLKIDNLSASVLDAATLVACLKYPMPKIPSENHQDRIRNRIKHLSRKYRMLKGSV